MTWGFFQTRLKYALIKRNLDEVLDGEVSLSLLSLLTSYDFKSNNTLPCPLCYVTENLKTIDFLVKTTALAFDDASILGANFKIVYWKEGLIN